MLNKSLSTFLQSRSKTALVTKFIVGVGLLAFAGNYFYTNFSIDLSSDNSISYTGEISPLGLCIFAGILFALFYSTIFVGNVFSSIFKLESLSILSSKVLEWRWSWVAFVFTFTVFISVLFLRFYVPNDGPCAFDFQCGPGRYCAETFDGVGGIVRSVSRFCLNNSENPPPPFLCLSSDTPIATPSGSILVKNIQQGDIVWSTDADGDRLAEPVMIAHRTHVPDDHHVMDIKLSDGQELFVSPGHKVHGGKSAGELRAGDILGNESVVSATLIPYGKPYTYDLLPAGATGEYWGNGVLLESTLK